jgi:nucleotide-binding universal stress UspA family protein
MRRQGEPDSAAQYLKQAWQRARTIGADLTEADILDIHALTAPGVRPGYRTTPVTFAGGGTAVPAQHVPRQMTQLVESGLARTDPEAFVREFLQIHPFEDGNGRVAVVLLNRLAPDPAGMRPLPNFFGETTPLVRAVKGAELWKAMNENLVRVYGEMEGITEELAHAGARLNQIYVDNEAAILAGTYKMDDDVRDLIIRIHDRAARAFEIQDDLIVMGQSQATAVDAVLLGHTPRTGISSADLDMLDDAFKQMLRATEISVAYVKGEGGYVGQFPLAVQQAKLLAAGDESITQLIRLAETLDPARAAQLADEAVAAGTPAAAARMPGKWAKIRAQHHSQGTPLKQHVVEVPTTQGAIDIRIQFPEPSVQRPYARIADIEWTADEADPSWGFRPVQRGEEMERARYALPGLKRLDEIVQELSDEGFTITAQARGKLLERYRRHGFVDDPNYPTVGPVNRLEYVNIVKYPAKRLQRATPYEKWEDAFKAAKTADKAVGHQDFISVGVRDGIDMDEANKLMQLIDRDISSMAETVRFDDVLQSIKRTAVPKGRTATPPSRGFETVDVPEPLVRPGEAPSVGERIVPGQPMAQYEHITSQDVLTAATAARDEARVVFADARVLRDRLAVLERRLEADRAAGAPIARLKREVRLVKDQAATAEIYAQSRARDAADLLDMTRVERAGEPFEDFFSRPWDKRDPKQIETFIDAVQDGTANFGPWRIVSGDDALDSNMVAAAEAFQRLIALKDQAHGFWKRWDKLTNWFKAGLIATPGFMYRNMFGAFLNAYLDGVNPNQIIRSATTVSRINKVAEKQNISFMQAARGMADESPYMKDFVTLLEQGVRGGGQATQSVNPYASTGEEGILGAIGLGRWGRGMTRGSSEAQNVPSGLRGPGRLIKSVADVTWESVPGTAQRGTLRNIGTVLPVGPGSSNWAYNKAIRSANMQMEDVIRLGVGMDTLRWGGTPQDALERIALSQFDYGELTETEQTIRRWVPFYTWTRKNVPYQFNKLVTNPAAYNRVMSVKRNMELGTEDEGVVPDWFMHPFGIRLPWEWGGARVYTTPDLPFADLFRYDPTRKIEGQGGIIPSGITEVKDNMLWQLSPIAKIPLEMAFGESLRGGFNFTGKYQTMPLVFSEMAGAPVMRGLANAVPGIRKRDGEWQIRDYLLYFLSSALPALSLSRRLMPTEERYQQRFIETIFSTIFGVSIQRQTPEVEEKWANRLENHLRREEARQRRDDGGRSSLLPPTVGSEGGGTSRVFP